ncbi:MAG: tetratricopeptide repeat protein [Proteobacteria bacterium]|nr:tetratricopeptide repeat protein [Pseudomonadota bacterium]
MIQALAEPARDPSAATVAALRAGDWTALATALAADSDHVPGDRALLRCLATGQLDGDPPPLPSYRLIRQVGPALAPALRLAALGAVLDAPRAETVLRIALAFAPDEPAVLLALAWRCQERSASADAVALARRARAADPAAAEATATLGWFLAESGDLDGAERELREALALAPHDAAAHLYLGITLHRRGRVSAAETALRAALALAPERDDVHLALGWLLHDLGRIDDALVHSEQAVVGTTTPASLLLHGWLLAQRDKPDAAIALLARASALAPNDVVMRCNLATVLARNGRAAEALRVVADGLAAAPGDPTLTIAAARLERELGHPEAAMQMVDGVLAKHAHFGPAWQLRATLHEDHDRVAEAEACVVRALAVQPHAGELIVWRARLICRMGRLAAALRLTEDLLAEQPHRIDANLLLAQLHIDLDRFQDARRVLHRLLRAGRRDPAVWRVLALALAGLGRLGAARRAVRRACRLAPTSSDALRLRAWLDHSTGDDGGAHAAVAALLALQPNDPRSLAQTAEIAVTVGALDEAERCAARAVVAAPEAADGWYVLGLLRQRQARWSAAEDCLHAAHRLAPARADVLRALGWVLIGDDRLAEAEIAFLRALEGAPDDPLGHLDLAECRRLAGRFAGALEAAERALALRPNWATARRVRAQNRIALARRADTERRALLWDAAAAELAGLLREARGDRETGRVLIGLAAEGCGAARAALRLIPRALRRELHREGLEFAVGHAGAAELAEHAALATAEFPDDLWIACAALNAAAMAGSLALPALQRRTRELGRRLALSTGMAPPPRLPTPRAGARLKVAYLAALIHDRLLLSVLAAHDRAAVEVLLYTRQVEAAEIVLGGAVQVVRLDAGTADSLRANRVDVVVDTVGLHPFLGQFDALRILAQRVAPVQCGWLGGWGSSGGLHDALIVDAVSAPVGTDAHYDEALVRLPGGQWCWTPPLHAPDPGPPPCRAHGHVVFGSTVRGFRLSRATLDAWGRLLARVPDARLELLGRQSRDWRLRDTIAAAMRDAGVDPARVGFQYQRAYADHLAFYRAVDIALDAFPGNGGLGLIDALWMGVPVVSSAAAPDGLLGSRQGAAVLHAIGHPEWCAATPDDYVARAAALAADPAGLAAIRARLRRTVLASPLVDARRVAAALEGAWRDLRATAAPVADATDVKGRAKAVARRALDGWLAHQQRLALPHAATPTVSVIVVLFNQAGLTRQALAALADQGGVAFETIIVDNASTDTTAALLDRIDGATILRNPENRHFLAAVNQAAELARGRYILLLNNDAIVQTGALAAAVDRLERDPTIGAVGGRIVLGDGTLQEAGCIAFGDGSTLGYGRGGDPDAAEFQFVRDVDFCSGVFLAVRTTLWRALGGFDPRYAPAYYEDTDLCLRIRQAGQRIVYDPAIVVGHVEWASAIDPDAAPAQMRRNQSVFLERHRAVLAERPAARAANPLIERWAARPGPRVLIVDNAVPHVAAGGGLPRARLMLHALDRHNVTLFPLWQFDDDWRAVAATVPEGTEVMLGRGAAKFEAFLAERAGVYDVMLISRPPNLA